MSRTEGPRPWRRAVAAAALLGISAYLVRKGLLRFAGTEVHTVSHVRSAPTRR